MSPPVLLGVDLGTSGVKVAAVGLDGRVHAEAEHGYPVNAAHPGWAESSPGDWWDATVAAVRAALGELRAVHVAAVGVDGQMHGLVLADASGTPTRPAILWADTRAVAETARWAELPDAARAALANPLVPGMTGPLLAWVGRHEPRALDRARAALLPKDWVRYRLTGAFATDPSDASATLLWDVPGDRWSEQAVRAAGVDRALLPAVVPSAGRAGEITAAAAGATGLPAGTPVACGAGDTAAGMLGTGLSDVADLQITVGSGAQIVRPVPRPDAAGHPRTHLYRAAAPGAWYAMAAVQNAGLALGWVRGVLGMSWDELYAAATAGPPGAGGVAFLPYLTGERTPVLNPAARGAWYGLGLGTDRAALAQAAVEGVHFAIRHAVEALPGGVPDDRPVRLAGGGTAAPELRGLLADVLRAPLRPIRSRSASAVGAARLAASAAGLPVPPAPVAEEDVVVPSARAAGYEGPYARYRELAGHLTGD